MPRPNQITQETAHPPARSSRTGSSSWVTPSSRPGPDPDHDQRTIGRCQPDRRLTLAKSKTRGLHLPARNAHFLQCPLQTPNPRAGFSRELLTLKPSELSTPLRTQTRLPPKGAQVRPRYPRVLRIISNPFRGPLRAARARTTRFTSAASSASSFKRLLPQTIRWRILHLCCRRSF